MDNFEAKKKEWAVRNKMEETGPPKVAHVLDVHGGVIAETTPHYSAQNPWEQSAVVTNQPRIGNTLWCSGDKLKEKHGVLIEGTVNKSAFYQWNEDVTSAKYKVAGYKYPVVLWWDNKTSERIA